VSEKYSKLETLYSQKLQEIKAMQYEFSQKNEEVMTMAQQNKSLETYASKKSQLYEEV
jgi:hypothetical protein